MPPYSQFERTLAKGDRGTLAGRQRQERHDCTSAALKGARAGLGRLFAVAEAYPELRANEHFMQLQTRISALENAIADRREWYNESVNVPQRGSEQFPDLIVARTFRFSIQPLLGSSQNEKRDVDVKALFGA